MIRRRLSRRGSTSARGTRRGACGGTPRRDGSGRGVGNRGTARQPRKRK